ncbi:vWA domain-containing protein [Halonotius sp. GCM10025705]|uniref:vWA domain-containing protein n=1 Tax=Halonotius sp. GCM10025705 TaxID=3252678 RepID=UPI00360BD247
MGKAIRESIELVEDRKEYYQNEGLHYRSPTIILITDGEPTDMSPDDEKWNEIQDLIGVGTNDAHFDLLITGIGGEPNMKTLEDLLSETNQSNAQIIQLDDSNIYEIGSYVAEFMPGHDLS